MNHNYFVFNRLEDGRHENIIHYFRYHVPSRDDNRGVITTTKIWLRTSGLSSYYFNILSCFMYRKQLKIFNFTLSLKHHSEDLFTIIFTSSIKFAWELFSIFPSVSKRQSWEKLKTIYVFTILGDKQGVLRAM